MYKVNLEILFYVVLRNVSFRLNENRRIAEWFELEGTLGGHLAQLPATNRDSLKPGRWGFVFFPSA